MFGYLNLGNPQAIGDMESQEVNNCRFDRGYLEYQTWTTDVNIGRLVRSSYLLGTGDTKMDIFINSSWPDGGIPRRGDASNYDILGIVSAGAVGVANEPHGHSHYPPGPYTYWVTLYDKNTGEESTPLVKTVTIATNGVARFGGPFSIFEGRGSLNPKKNLIYRIYRIPLGGTEALLVNYGTEISGMVDSDPSYVYDDEIPDNELGDVCKTEGNYALTVYMADYGGNPIPPKYIVKWQDRLWFSNISKVRFSKLQSVESLSLPSLLFSAFPVETFLEFDQVVQTLLVVNEVMYVICENAIFAIYGDSEETFVSKKLQSDGIGAPLSYGSFVCNGIAFLIGNYPSGTTNNSAKYGKDIFVVQGGNVEKISSKIDSLFPFSPKQTTGPIVQDFKTGTVENRFWVLDGMKLLKSSPSLLSDYEDQQIVFDTIGRGFLTGSSTPNFSYRTKEFSIPIKTSKGRRFYVEGEGSITVEYYGNEVLLTTKSFYFPKKQRQWFYVKPQRVDTFSLRFVGSSTAKIYEFGKVDE